MIWKKVTMSTRILAEHAGFWRQTWMHITSNSQKLRTFILTSPFYKTANGHARAIIKHVALLSRTIVSSSKATLIRWKKTDTSMHTLALASRIYETVGERMSSLWRVTTSKSKTIYMQWEKNDISAHILALASRLYKTVGRHAKAVTKRTVLLWYSIVSSARARYIAWKKANAATRILAEHAGFSHQIWYLAWMDLQKSYRGALLGWLWVVVRPLMMLGFYWFIIAIGLHSDSIGAGNYEYLPWLIIGLCAWFFISDMINVGVGAFRKYKFLIAKTKFPVATIPTIVLISNAIIHGILLTFVLGYLYASGYVALEWLQVPLYIILTLALMWFWSLLAAPLGAISKDFTQLVKSVMRVLVWVSGILWSIQNIPIQWLREIMQLNPIYFLAEGYRKSLMYHEWFFEDMRGFLIFMTELAVLAALATVVYKRSRKDLADIL